MRQQDKWLEFEKRLANLVKGGYKKHDMGKLKEYLQYAAARATRTAAKLYERGDTRFKQYVVEAEKCMHILAVLEGLDLSLEDAA